jgi:hypothetical protein
MTKLTKPPIHDLQEIQTHVGEEASKQDRAKNCCKTPNHHKIKIRTWKTQKQQVFRNVSEVCWRQLICFSQIAKWWEWIHQVSCSAWLQSTSSSRSTESNDEREDDDINLFIEWGKKLAGMKSLLAANGFPTLTINTPFLYQRCPIWIPRIRSQLPWQ